MQLWKHRQRQQPLTPDALLERYLIYTNYVILYLYLIYLKPGLSFIHGLKDFLP